jgi:hypothetical protein
MAKNKQCKVPTKKSQRLDHVTKLEASLPRQCRCDWSGDRGGSALCIAPALLQGSLSRLLTSISVAIIFELASNNKYYIAIIFIIATEI